MTILLRFYLVLTVLRLVGCGSNVEHQWSGPEHEIQPPQQKLVHHAPEPIVTPVIYEVPTPGEHESQPQPTSTMNESMKLAPQSLSLSEDITLASRLYLSKAGELMADLTIGNNNVVSVNHVTVKCVEYNMNDSVVRETSSTLNEILQVGESVYWDQVNFGYVHNDFETVQCQISDAKLS